jgi:hypothetical protein
MAIVNRRNAVLGWTVWKVGKRVAKRKARDVVPRTGGRSRLNKSALASLLAAVGGALFFWRKKSDGTAEKSDGTADE